MEIATRNELIDTYYRAADEEDYDLMVSVFDEDITYLYPNEPDMYGIPDVREFFEERRKTTGTTHDVFRRVHGDDATMCEGTITGEIEGEGPFEGAYVGAFEFDEDSQTISYVAVYTRL